jgi:hypothetical protein
MHDRKITIEKDHQQTLVRLPGVPRGGDKPHEIGLTLASNATQRIGNTSITILSSLSKIALAPRPRPGAATDKCMPGW